MTDVILNVKDIVLGDKVKHPDAVTLEQAVVQIMRDSLRLEVTERTDSKHVNVTLWADIDENSYKIDEIDFDV